MLEEEIVSELLLELKVSLEELKVSKELLDECSSELLLNELELTSTKLDELRDIEEQLGVPDIEPEDEVSLTLSSFTSSSPEHENANKAASVKIAVSKVNLVLFMFEM
jgi:hypothetical protein